MDKVNKKRYKAISIRYKPTDWDELQEMKQSFQEMTGIVMTTNKFVKLMCCDGYTAFMQIALAQNIE